MTDYVVRIASETGPRDFWVGVYPGEGRTAQERQKAAIARACEDLDATPSGLWRAEPVSQTRSYSVRAAREAQAERRARALTQAADVIRKKYHGPASADAPDDIRTLLDENAILTQKNQRLEALLDQAQSEL